jgi:Secretion system C-terminal sorting domain
MKQLALLLFAFSLQVNLSAQIEWTYNPSAPMMSYDTASNMWGAYGQPTVIMQNDTFKMWYAVAEGEDSLDPIARGRIHYAWSLDGTTWNKHTNNPVLDISGAGQWDGEWLDSPEILWDGNNYKLYYYGDSTFEQGQSNTALGVATSNNGIDWTRNGKVLEKGALGDWDGYFIESPAAYYNATSGLYALLYTGIDTSRYGRLGLAVSVDGYNFIKYPSHAVVEIGPYPSWNDIASATPALIETNGIIEMWYCGVSNDNGQYDSSRVGYALSLNGIDWLKYPGNPVLKSKSNDKSSFWAIDVVFDSTQNKYFMYYEDFWIYGDSLDPDTVNAIYYATAPRNTLFSSNCITSISNNSIINQGDTTQLLATGGDFYLWEPASDLSNPNISNPMASPDTTTMYRVLIVSDSCITVDTVIITVSPLGVNNTNLENDIINIYPNPSSSNITVEFSNPNKESLCIHIYNSMGQLVKSVNNITSEKTNIEIANLKSGIYLIELNSKDRVFRSEKLIIQ